MGRKTKKVDGEVVSREGERECEAWTRHAQEAVKQWKKKAQRTEGGTGKDWSEYAVLLQSAIYTDTMRIN